ncbi:MAG: MFS transporter [Oscillospiraceae bacterium]
MSTTTKKFSGWSVFAGCFLLMFFGNGIIAGTTALFVAPICGTFGFDLAAYSVVTLLGSIASAVSSTVLAGKMQKGNMKMIMLACMIISGVSFSVMGLCTELWQFYLVFVICNLGFGGVAQLPVAMLITAWFDDKRSIVMSLSFAGNGTGTAIWAMIFSKMIAGGPNGWQMCYFIGGGIVVVVCSLITLLLVKKDPQSCGQQAYLQDPSKKAKSSNKEEAVKDDWVGVDKKIAFKTTAFMMMAALILLLGCALTGVTSHVVNYLITIGWATTDAGSVVSVMSLVGIFGVVLGGFLFEKLGPRNGIFLACTFYILAFASLFFAKNPIFGYAFAIIFPLGGMLPRLVPALLTSRVFGTKDYASIYAILNVFFLVGCSVGAVLTGVIYNIAGYTMAWTVYIVFAILMAVCANFALIDGKRLRAKYPNEA